MRTLLIDNYDSFTYNLYQMIAELSGELPIVIRNDEMDWDNVQKLDFAQIVVSPGPGRPDRYGDFGISRDAIVAGQWPVLGVCLGHQGICHYFGGSVTHAPVAMHGRVSAVFHDGSRLFHDMPSPFNVVRYHSLMASDVPNCLRVTARTADGIVMALEHTELPIMGVQFHPESICSEHGHQLIANFLGAPIQRPRAARATAPVSEAAGSGFKAYCRMLPYWTDSEAVFQAMFASANPSFWLDSSTLIPGTSRFSFMGDTTGPHSESISYDSESQRLTITRGTRCDVLKMSILEYLDRRMKERRLPRDPQLPFEFTSGYVGYFGYELKRDAGDRTTHCSESPDAFFLFADRVVCFDHEEKRIWLLCFEEIEEEERARNWFNLVESRIRGVSTTSGSPTAQGSPRISDFNFRDPDEHYEALIGRCLSEIGDGESYEICLTNQLSAAGYVDGLPTYLALRRRNPAPYSAFLRFGDTRVLCSSPERFIKCTSEGEIESKPIKGTIRRGKTEREDRELSECLRTSEKDRAENLMIVDLIRNDMGRVCEIGSVTVPSLFGIETYATVHQLVSTVRGQLSPGQSIIDVVRSMFPGGSMTGAPKRRTMEIIDQLESGPRGIYSGALGFLSLNGASDLNIVIRTIVASGTGVTIGVGGAITALSSARSELDEIKLKAKALVETLRESACVPPCDRSGKSTVDDAAQVSGV